MPKRKADSAKAVKGPKRTKHEFALPPERMASIVGKVFMTTHCYRAPDVFRVVGLTKSRKSAHLEPVPLQTIGEDWHGNGSRKIDCAWLLANPVHDADGQCLRRTHLTAVPRLDNEDSVSFPFQKIYRLHEVSDLDVTIGFCDY